MQTNPFGILLAITGFIIVVSIIFGVIAPNVGVSMPSAPEFPTWASDLNWTVTLTDWSGIGSFFTFVGGGLVYLISYIGFMGATLTLFWSFLGIVPVVAMAITVLIVIAFGGSLLMFLRGSSGGEK